MNQPQRNRGMYSLLFTCFLVQAVLYALVCADEIADEGLGSGASFAWAGCAAAALGIARYYDREASR
jgi:hypothetical protein